MPAMILHDEKLRRAIIIALNSPVPPNSSGSRTARLSMIGYEG